MHAHLVWQFVHEGWTITEKQEKKFNATNPHGYKTYADSWAKFIKQSWFWKRKKHNLRGLWMSMHEGSMPIHGSHIL